MDSKKVDLNAVVAGVMWAIGIALCIAATVVALVLHKDTGLRMLAFTFMMFGLVVVAVAAVLSIRISVRGNRRFFAQQIELYEDVRRRLRSIR